MKSSSIPEIIGTLLLLACCFANFNVFANAPLERDAHRIIKSIDHQKQILTLTCALAPGPQKLIWKSDTQFMRDLKPVAATELKVGMDVTIYCHSPFFGKNPQPD
jgi:hypothetical protein